MDLLRSREELEQAASGAFALAEGLQMEAPPQSCLLRNLAQGQAAAITSSNAHLER